MSETTPTTLKSGFAVLIGRSNVGKSSLLNALVGSKIAITTPKPQTTRLPIHGILSNDQGQIVFVDTPGLMQKAKDPLTKKLHEYIHESLRDIDMILYVVDPTRAIGPEEKAILQIIERVEKPKILVINKVDLQHKPFIDFYRDLSPQFNFVAEVSTISNHGIQELIKTIFSYLKPGEPYYPPGQITNLPNDQWVAELIREKLFLRLRQEVPYSVSVEVEEMEERPNGMLYIKANILTTEERYQRMIIGKGARGIKEIGQSTRRELEAVMLKKVFLDLNVAVDPHWVERMA